MDVSQKKQEVIYHVRTKTFKIAVIPGDGIGKKLLTKGFVY